LRVVLTVDNRARDHWLRANFPTGAETDISLADTHFDIVSRPIAPPDSTGWVERACATHPLQTFAALHSGDRGLAIMPKGLFEYEAFQDDARTLALTLIRACRIKLAVSEEKKTELPDPGVQCPGMHRFEYAIRPLTGQGSIPQLLNAAAERAVPVRSAMTGRGKGALKLEMSLLAVDNPDVHVSCVKHAEDGSGLIVRLFNPTDEEQSATIRLGRPVSDAVLCRTDEQELQPIAACGNTVTFNLEPRKIGTLKIRM